MKIKLFMKLLASLTILSAFGCGGGGGGSTPAPTNTVSGVVAKGPVSGGTVKVFAVNEAGVVGDTAIGTGSSNTNGTYSVNVGTYKGALLVEVTGGDYKDEATGITVPLTIPLRAAIAESADGDNKVAVTPLTELAVKKAGTLTASAIIAANLNVGKAFNLADIIATQPLDATVAPPTTATTAQKSYGLALATVSRMIMDKPDSTLQSLMTRMGNEFAGDGLTGETVTGINSAMAAFVGSDGNKTGVVIGDVTPLKPTSGILKISTVGILDAGSLIEGADLTVILPAGVSVQADASGQPAPGVVAVSGVAAAAVGGATDFKISEALFTPTNSTIRIVMSNTAGFGAGEFITIKCDIASSATFPQSADFAVPLTSFFISGGTDLNNPVTLTGFTPLQTFIAVIP